MKSLRQWITYTTRPRSGQPDKLDKLPTDWRSGQIADAHDPAIWTDYDTAKSHGEVGFVFTEQDPFWFLDIDSCLMPDNTWSPLALELVALLPQSYCEVSISGRGLHLFGTGQVPRHGTRNTPLGLEFYHSGRFVAYTGTGRGDCRTDCTAGIATLVERYFPKTVADVTPADWTTEPCAEWAGPIDDEELIRRMRNAKSVSGIFGNRATFDQLWTADKAALKLAYPDPARDYDASSADMALAQHLAFWTGKHSERMERLMRMSSLARPKWDEHRTYIRDTVTHATSRQVEVYKQAAPVLAAATESTLAVRDKAGETWLTPEDMKVMFDGCTYVQATHTILCPGGHNLSEGRFNVRHGGYSYTLDRTAGKVAKNPWDAFVNSRDVHFPRVDVGEFRPEMPAGARWDDEGTLKVNSYWPVKVLSKKGNIKPFLDHMHKLFPDENDRIIMLSYMAAIVQHPGVNFDWCPVIQGAEGNGKSLISRCVERAVGEKFSHWPKAHELGEKFNAWIENKIFIAVDDIFRQGDKQEVAETLKGLITGDRLEIRGMGQEKITKRVCANFILNSNYKDAVKKSADTRRYAIFYTPQQSNADIIRDGMGGDYFPRLYTWLRDGGYAMVTHYLQNMVIDPKYNPAALSKRAPVTTSQSEAVTVSHGELEQEIFEAIEQEKIGFRGGFVSSHYLDLLIRERRLESKYPRNRRTAIMSEIGYTVHPAFKGGAVNNPVAPDGCRPRLYMAPDCKARGFAEGYEVTGAYSLSQGA